MGRNRVCLVEVIRDREKGWEWVREGWKREKWRRERGTERERV